MKVLIGAVLAFCLAGAGTSRAETHYRPGPGGKGWYPPGGYYNSPVPRPYVVIPWGWGGNPWSNSQGYRDWYRWVRPSPHPAVIVVPPAPLTQ